MAGRKGPLVVHRITTPRSSQRSDRSFPATNQCKVPNSLGKPHFSRPPVRDSAESTTIVVTHIPGRDPNRVASA
jgi:hypothetical protein